MTDEAQKTFVVREMMPKEIQGGFLTGTKKFDEMKLEVIINGMMADEGALPMDLMIIGVHCAKNDSGRSRPRQHHVIRRRVRGCMEGAQSRHRIRHERNEWNRNVEPRRRI